MKAWKVAALIAASATMALNGQPSQAASHSDAPLIKQDPQANITDVYAFIGNNRMGKKVLNVVVQVRPFSEPGDGVMYERFGDDALYSIHIAHPVTGATICTYEFKFSAVNGGNKNLNTILSYGLGTEAGPIQNVGDARQNYTQTYTITRVKNGQRTLLNGGMTLMVPPPNVGARTTPFYNDTDGRAVSGATTYDELDRYTKQTTYDLASGETTFAGSRDDGFFADTPGIFDLLDSRILGDSFGQAGGGVDGFKGFNILSYAIQIPVESLPSLSYSAAFTGAASGVGVYASVSRPRLTLRRSDGDPVSVGSFVQVNRMGNPLFNEVLVALADKDRYNRTSPTQDAALFKKYAENPELPFLINFVIFGDPTGQSPLATTGRADLVAVYIPDVLRVNTGTGPVKVAGQVGFSRLSLLGGDTTDGASGGWPNGRRLGDDVVDIALTAVASGPTYASILVVGDNIAANDTVYNQVFPYSATPHSGPRNSKDSGPN